MGNWQVFCHSSFKSAGSWTCGQSAKTSFTPNSHNSKTVWFSTCHVLNHIEHFESHPNQSNIYGANEDHHFSTCPLPPLSWFQARRKVAFILRSFALHGQSSLMILEVGDPTGGSKRSQGRCRIKDDISWYVMITKCSWKAPRVPRPGQRLPRWKSKTRWRWRLRPSPQRLLWNFFSLSLSLCL